ncbi:MAG: hypothetical protein ACKO8I_08330, partial [Cyanobacteriota bacterium]
MGGRCGALMARLVIVDPAYASTVGHHGELNRPLLAGLTQAGWRAELWADVLLEAEGSAPGPLRGVFSGCGYGDPRHWRELGGMVQLGRMLEQQLSAASAGGEPVAAWVAHSLLPFQLLGLARHLAQAPRAQVLISLMFAPGETLEAAAETPAAITNCRVALAALARACGLRGHRLRLVFPSQQQLRLYEPLLEATGLSHCGLHPAVVGAGCMPTPPSPDQPPLVLLHWGDHKAGKGQREALAVLHTLIEQGVPRELAGWDWLFHQHSNLPMPPADRTLLERAEVAGLGLVWLSGEVESERMGQWLARCPLALLAYDPQAYRQRSSGLLWQWAACRAALALPALAVGYGGGWLAAEAPELGVGWRTPPLPPQPQPPDAGDCPPTASVQGVGWGGVPLGAKPKSETQGRASPPPPPSP